MNLKKEYGAKVMSLFSSSVTLIKVVIFPVGWFFFKLCAQTLHSGLLHIGYETHRSETYRCITYRSKTCRLLYILAFRHIAYLIIWL
jgi:hypothetical protein